MVSSLDQRAANRERSNARWVIDFRLSGHPVCVPLNAGSLTLLLPVLQVSLSKRLTNCKKFQTLVFIPARPWIRAAPESRQTVLVFISFSEIYFNQHLK